VYEIPQNILFHIEQINATLSLLSFGNSNIKETNYPFVMHVYPISSSLVLSA